MGSSSLLLLLLWLLRPTTRYVVSSDFAKLFKREFTDLCRPLMDFLLRIVEVSAGLVSVRPSVAELSTRLAPT
jgi:hypothetical protein